MLKPIYTFLAFLASLVPSFSYAQNVTASGLRGLSAIGSLISTVTNFLLTLVGGAAIIFIIIGGIQYITSAGNTQRAEGAKKTITYAVIGLVVVLLSRIALPIILGIFT